MVKPGEFEIPQHMRDMAEKSVEKAQEAFGNFLDATKKAQTVVNKSSDAITSGTKELNQKAIEYTTENMQANFDLAENLVKAKDLKEAIEIQNEFARQQMEKYAQQAQELTSMATELVQKSQPKKK